MKKRYLLLVCLMSILLSSNSVLANQEKQELIYECITQEEAYRIFSDEKEEDVLILDVREPEEYEDGHIPGAILFPLGDIEEQCEEILKEKDQRIYVYCRSGRRSKLAAEILVKKGYSNIYEFGGIIDWEYETEQGTYEPSEESDECESELCTVEFTEAAETECHHEWMEDCISKTCSKCGEYHRITP